MRDKVNGFQVCRYEEIRSEGIAVGGCRFLLMNGKRISGVEEIGGIK